MIDTLGDMLLEFSRASSPEGRKAIEAEIWRQFGAERTVLVVDMSGFSLLTRRHGVVHYLSMVRRMQELVRPIIHQHGGSVVKFEADNAFAVFPDLSAGIRAAQDMNAAAEKENERYSDEFDIRLSCGLDHGRILLLEGRDFFGDAVNGASKLGEDLAVPGEILVTASAMNALPEAERLPGKEVSFSLSGLRFDAISI